MLLLYWYCIIHKFRLNIIILIHIHHFWLEYEYWHLFVMYVPYRFCCCDLHSSHPKWLPSILMLSSRHTHYLFFYFYFFDFRFAFYAIDVYLEKEGTPTFSPINVAYTTGSDMNVYYTYADTHTQHIYKWIFDFTSWFFFWLLCA